MKRRRFLSLSTGFGLAAGLLAVIGCKDDQTEDDQTNVEQAREIIPISRKTYIAPYMGDFDGNVSEEWFPFYERVVDWHTSNQIPLAASFYPYSMTDPAFDSIIANMYSSPAIELVLKGEALTDTPLEQLTPAEFQANIEGALARFREEMTTQGISDPQMPVAYNQLLGEFTPAIRDVLADLGFKMDFDQYVGESGVVDSLPDFIVMQYAVGFTPGNLAGREYDYKAPWRVVHELAVYEDENMLRFEGDPIIPLLTHQQDFESRTEENRLAERKWADYTQTLLALKSMPEVYFVLPTDIYEMRRGLS